MTPIRIRPALAAVLVVCAAVPALAAGFRDSHFGPNACYVRLDHPDQEQVARPTRQMVTLSIKEDTDAEARLSADEMALSMAVSGKSGREGRRLAATCDEGSGNFECVVGRDRGHFTLTPQGENLLMRVDEVNMPGNDGNRRGLVGALGGHGEEKDFVLVRAEQDLCR